MKKYLVINCDINPEPNATPPIVFSFMFNHKPGWSDMSLEKAESLLTNSDWKYFEHNSNLIIKSTDPRYTLLKKESAL